MAKENLITTAQINTTVRAIDFANSFTTTWQHLKDIMSAMRMIRKAPGTALKSKYAVGELQEGKTAEGEATPYSQYRVEEKYLGDMTIEQYAKGVSIQAIEEYGYDDAVAMTDAQFLADLQGEVADRFWAFLKTGTLTTENPVTTFQMAMAKAKGLVVNEFKKMRKTVTEVVAFVNVQDVYDYLGTQKIDEQNQFGWNYLKDFMGYRTVFLLSDNEVERGHVYATPVNNMILYYTDPADSEYAKAGFKYEVADMDISLIGVNVEANHNTGVSEMNVVLGMFLFAEYLNGIAHVNLAEGEI